MFKNKYLSVKIFGYILASAILFHYNTALSNIIDVEIQCEPNDIISYTWYCEISDGRASHQPMVSREGGFEELYNSGVKSGNLKFQLDLPDRYQDSYKEISFKIFKNGDFITSGCCKIEVPLYLNHILIIVLKEFLNGGKIVVTPNKRPYTLQRTASGGSWTRFNP